MLWDILKNHPGKLVTYGTLIAMLMAGWVWGVDWFISTNKIIIEDTLKVELIPLATKNDLKIAVIDIKLALVNKELRFYTDKGVTNLTVPERIKYTNLLKAKENEEKARNTLLGLD